MKVKLVVAVILLLASTAFANVLDDFNRPNNPTLGPSWTAQAGQGEIFNNMARASNGMQDSNLLTFNGVNENSAFVDVYDIDGSLSYIALVIGFADVNNNYFIKVQDQGGGGQFNDAAFYYGNNAGGLFFALDSAFSSARLTASFVGTVATLDIDTNFDGIPDQIYTYDYGVSTGGNGIGLGLYGTAQADNFGTGQVTTPEPSSLLLLGSGLALMVGAIRRRIQ